jgi:hypothetical protein
MAAKSRDGTVVRKDRAVRRRAHLDRSARPPDMSAGEPQHRAPHGFVPPRLPPLTGDEKFSAGDATVRDFWRWALGDLRMNNARGYLAEFLVARAVGASQPARIEWADFDVTAPNGARIEVKTSAYLQSWWQDKLSAPRFSLVGAAVAFDDERNEYYRDHRPRVNVWVFCLQTCRSHKEYQPLDVSQWCFWVASNAVIDDLAQNSAALSTIERAAGPAMAWEDLRAAVEAASAPAAAAPN